MQCAKFILIFLGFIQTMFGCSDPRRPAKIEEEVGSLCGNAVLNEGELCDGILLAGNSCISQGFSGGTLGCLDTCLGFDLSQCLEKEKEKENSIKNKEICGNGVVESVGEECDGNDLNGLTCVSYGYKSGFLSCNNECRVEVFNCSLDPQEKEVIPGCGDNVLDDNEDCDGFQFQNNISCTSEGFAGGVLACNDDCSVNSNYCFAEEDESTQCGDGQLDDDEACDGLNLGGALCVSFGFEQGLLRCQNNCRFDFSECFPRPPLCGNETIETGEACDGSALGDWSCERFGFDSGDLSCSSDCTTINVDNCITNEEELPVCGDGTLNGEEECDGVSLGGETCASLGFEFGLLECNNNCTYNTSNCISN